MRKLAFKLTGHAAAAGLISGFIMATLVAAGTAGAADLSAGDGEQDRAIYVCGHRMDHIILFDEEGRPTVPARTPMYYCITRGHAAAQMCCRRRRNIAATEAVLIQVV